MTDLNAAYHKRTCEQLLAEGRATASQISDTKDRRETVRDQYQEGQYLNAREASEIIGLTERMDELGKKAMGIWAQAQIHATLATIDDGSIHQ